MKRIIVVLLLLLALAPAAAHAATTRVPSFYEGLTITSSSVTFAVPAVFTCGTKDSAGIQWTGDPNTGFWCDSADVINVTTGGTTRASFRAGSLALQTQSAMGWSSGDPSSAGIDVMFARRAAGTSVVSLGGSSFSAATNSAVVGGVFCVNTTSTATTGTVEEVLATCTLPANALSANGKGVRISATATTAANGNTKVYRIRFGGIAGGQLVAPTITTSGAGVAAIAYVIRTGSGAQYGWGSATTGTDGAAGNASMNDVVLGVTDTGTIDIVVTGTTATAAGDLTHKAIIVEFFN